VVRRDRRIDTPDPVMTAGGGPAADRGPAARRYAPVEDQFDRTRLGLHAQDNQDPAGPMIIHASPPGETDGYRIQATWDTLRMHATRSDGPILEGAFIPGSLDCPKVATLALDVPLGVRPSMAD
jgi:hypothetical protein